MCVKYYLALDIFESKENIEILFGSNKLEVPILLVLVNLLRELP